MKTLFSIFAIFVSLINLISAQPPEFTPNHNVEVCGPNNVYFVCTAPLNPHNITWYFGDGTTASGTTVVHYYNTTGVYDVKLVVEKDGIKDSIIKPAFVTIKPNPKSKFIRDITPTADPFKRSFTFCGFSNADTIVNYSWKINDTAIASSPNLVYVFPRRDWYHVSLEVTNDRGCAHTYSDSVYISGEPLELALDKKAMSDWFKVAVTPDQQFLRIECVKPLSEQVTVQVYDITGKVLVRQAIPAGNAVCLISLAHIPPGFQIVEISNQTFRSVKRIEKYMQ